MNEALTSGPTPKGLKSFQVDEDIELKFGEYLHLGGGIYIVKDNYFMFLCEKKANGTEWPKGFRRICTLTPGKMKEIKMFSLKLPGYDF